MSRYLPDMRAALALGKLPRIERLPAGTSRTEGLTFEDAKASLLVEMREARDNWVKACTKARRLTRDKLTLEEVWDGEDEPAPVAESEAAS